MSTTRTAPTADAVTEALMPAVGALRRLLRRVAGSAFDGDTLSVSQREVLVVIGKHPGSPVAEIARELGMAPNSVSTIVTQLVTAGLIVRETDPHDRRVGRLSLTPQARGEAASAVARRRGVLHDALDGLSQEQIAALAAGIDALGALAAQLHEQDEQTEAAVSR